MSRMFAGYVRPVVLSLIVFTCALAVLPWLLRSEEARVMLYADESGMFEQLSIVLWLLLTVALPVLIRPFRWTVLAGMVVCLGAAAREADWHKSFTGESVLKFSYYLDGSYPILARLGFAVLVIACIASLVFVGLRLFEAWRARGQARPHWAQLLVVFLVVAVVSKVFDRTPNILAETYGVILPDMLQQMMQACEEGLEMVLPVLLAVAAVAYTRDRPATAPAVQQVDPA